MPAFKKVLLIDDDALMTMLIDKTMKFCKFSEDVLIYNDANLAKSYLHEVVQNGITESPELIIIDINLGYMTGWQFLDWYSEIAKLNNFSRPVYIMSSSGDPDDVEKAAQYQVVEGFIRKPVNKRDLERIIEEQYSL